MTAKQTISKRPPRKSPRPTTRSRRGDREAGVRQEITELLEQIDRGLDAIGDQADRLLAKLR